MDHAAIFSLDRYWWFYAGFLGFVLVLLALDLGVLNRKAKEVSIGTALRWTVAWVSLALLFCGAFWLWASDELRKPELAAAYAISATAGDDNPAAARAVRSAALGRGLA